jgi:hypothetical protein
MTTICLIMIIGNESKNIKTTLDSVSPIIDAYCIADIGSTDSTPDIIKQYFKHKKIPGEIISIPRGTQPSFNGFYSETITTTLNKAAYYGTYALYVDRELAWISPTFNKQDLHLDYYQISTNPGVIPSHMTRLMRTDKHIKCIGDTYEYFTIDNLQGEKLHTLTLNSKSW